MERRHYQQLLLALAGGHFGGSIASCRLDEPMLALIRPVLETEINARISQIDRKLTALGIDVDEPAATA